MFYILKIELVNSNQVIDFVSGKKQSLYIQETEELMSFRFGISTGIDSIPTALTIQKGRTQSQKG